MDRERQVLARTDSRLNAGGGQRMNSGAGSAARACSIDEGGSTNARRLVGVEFCRSDRFRIWRSTTLCSRVANLPQAEPRNYRVNF
jgi:hypothetical protein